MDNLYLISRYQDRLKDTKMTDNTFITQLVALWASHPIHIILILILLIWLYVLFRPYWSTQAKAQPAIGDNSHLIGGILLPANSDYLDLICRPVEFGLFLSYQSHLLPGGKSDNYYRISHHFWKKPNRTNPTLFVTFRLVLDCEGFHIQNTS